MKGDKLSDFELEQEVRRVLDRPYYTPECDGVDEWWFQPLTESNLQLRDEFEVSVDYWRSRVFILDSNGEVKASVSFSGEINRAVCLCILESAK